MRLRMGMRRMIIRMRMGIGIGEREMREGRKENQTKIQQKYNKNTTKQQKYNKNTTKIQQKYNKNTKNTKNTGTKKKNLLDQFVWTTRIIQKRNIIQRRKILSNIFLLKTSTNIINLIFVHPKSMKFW